MDRKVLILTDGKAGHENQSKALARGLGCDFDLVTVKVSPGQKPFTYLLDLLVDGLHLPFLSSVADSTFKAGELLATLHTRGYAAVIGTGSGTFFAVKCLSRRLGVKGAVVLYPRGYRLGGFDCIVAPSFDRPKAAKNLVEIPANLVASDSEYYDRAAKEFETSKHRRERSAVAVIVGGPNKCSTMTAEWMKAQLVELFARHVDCEMWVTTSRRTPADVEAVVKSFPWQYRLLYSEDHYNPIPAFMKLAERVYVTAESTGMISEACTFGKTTVSVLDNLKPGKHKFRRFVENLTHEGYLEGSRKIDLSAQYARVRSLMGW